MPAEADAQRAAGTPTGPTKTPDGVASLRVGLRRTPLRPRAWSLEIGGGDDLRETHRQFAAAAWSDGWTMRGVFVIGWDGGGNPFGIETSTGQVLVEDHDFGGVHEMAPSFEVMLLRGLGQEL